MLSQTDRPRDAPRQVRVRVRQEGRRVAVAGARGRGCPDRGERGAEPVLSVLAADYPAGKLACFVSDDSARGAVRGHAVRAAVRCHSATMEAKFALKVAVLSWKFSKLLLMGIRTAVLEDFLGS
uniref:Uncharacterized protein n=1 Tax=Arundo donax TaxID=35708 RepID=A0A0A8YBV1_ARUDO